MLRRLRYLEASPFRVNYEESNFPIRRNKRGNEKLVFACDRQSEVIDVTTIDHGRAKNQLRSAGKSGFQMTNQKRAILSGSRDVQKFHR